MDCYERVKEIVPEEQKNIISFAGGGE